MIRRGIWYLGLAVLMLTSCTGNEQGASERSEPAIESETLTETVSGTTSAAETSAVSEIKAADETPAEVNHILPERTIATRIAADGKIYYGVVDGQGKTVIPFQYYMIQEVQGGYSTISAQQDDYQKEALDYDGNPADFDPEGPWPGYMQIGQGDLYQKSSEDYFDITICRAADDQELLHFSNPGDFRAKEVHDTSGNRRLFVQVEEGAGNYFTIYDLDALLAGTPAQVSAALLARHDGLVSLYTFDDNPVNVTDRLIYAVDIENLRYYGLVDPDGNIVVDPIYRYLDNGSQSGPYEYDIFAARNADWLFGYIDKDDHVLIPFQYKAAQPFYQGYAAVKLDDGTAAVIDKAGTQVSRIEASGDEFYYGWADYTVMEDGWTAVKYDGTILDLRTLLQEEPAEDAAYTFNEGYGRLFMAVERYWPETLRRQFGLLNPDSGEWLIPFSESDTMSDISINTDATYIEYRLSEDNDVWEGLKTLYNMDGDVIVTGYDRLVTAGDEVFLVETEERWAWYDTQGNQQLEFVRPELID